MQIQTIEVQTIRHGMPEKTTVVQNDSARLLRCILTDYVIPDDTTARLYAKKPTGAIVYNDCVIIDNTVELELTNQLLAETGTVCCQIELTKAKNTLTSFEFCIDVKRQLKDNKAIESSNEFTALENAFNEVESLKITGAVVDGPVSFQQGIRGHALCTSTSHGKGQAGWQHAFQVTTTGVYQNQLLEFSISQRHRIGKLYIKLASSSTAGTVKVESFYTIGNIYVSYVCLNNVLDVYIQKSEAYDEIDCIITQKGSYMNNTHITWVDKVVSSLPDGAVAALLNTNNINFTATTNGGTALIVDNVNSADDRTYIAFKNKGANAGYLSMSGNDLYTYKNSTNCKVLDSKNYMTVITDYMTVFEAKNSIKLKVPISKTTDTSSFYSGTLESTIKAENPATVAFVNNTISLSNANITYRGDGRTIEMSIENIVGTNYIYITLKNKSSTRMIVEFSSNSGIFVEQIL